MHNENARRNPAQNYRYQPKQVDAIIVREFAFEFADDLDFYPAFPADSVRWNILP